MAQQYPNRSDLRNPAQKIARQAATGQTYGEAGQQMAAQRAVPMAQSPATAPAQQAKPRPTPGSLGALDRPTERPNDVLMPMPNAAPGMFTPANPVLEELSLLYAQFPNDDLADLIDVLKSGG